MLLSDSLLYFPIFLSNMENAMLVVGGVFGDIILKHVVVKVRRIYKRAAAVLSDEKEVHECQQ